MHSHFIYEFEVIFITSFGIFSCKLLHHIDNSSILCKIEINKIRRSNLKITCRFKTVHHLFLSIISDKLALTTTLERKNIDPVSVNGDKIFLGMKEESCDLRFPKLESFMSEQNLLVWSWNVNNLDTISVHKYCFETNH